MDDSLFAKFWCTGPELVSAIGASFHGRGDEAWRTMECLSLSSHDTSCGRAQVEMPWEIVQFHRESLGEGFCSLFVYVVPVSLSRALSLSFGFYVLLVGVAVEHTLRDIGRAWFLGDV